MQNYRNVNTAAFTFKEETDLMTPSQQNNKSPSEKSSLPHREGWVSGLAESMPLRSSSQLQAERWGSGGVLLS